METQILRPHVDGNETSSTSSYHSSSALSRDASLVSVSPSSLLCQYGNNPYIMSTAYGYWPPYNLLSHPMHPNYPLKNQHWMTLPRVESHLEEQEEPGGGRGEVQRITSSVPSQQSVTSDGLMILSLMSAQQEKIKPYDDDIDEGTIKYHSNNIIRHHQGKKGSVTIHYCHFNGCGYRSNRISNLQNHIRVHTREKPFICDLCSYASANISNLRTHKKRHERKGGLKRKRQNKD